MNRNALVWMSTLAVAVAAPGCKLAAGLTGGDSDTPADEVAAVPGEGDRGGGDGEDYSSDIARLPDPDDTTPGWEGPLYVVTGAQAGCCENEGRGQVSISGDGKAWKIAKKTRRADKHTYMASAIGNGRIVTVHESGALVSRDGSSWEEAEEWATYDNGTALNAEDVAFGDGLFVSVGKGTNIAASRDGLTWARFRGEIDPELGAGRVHLNEIKFIDGKFYVTGNQNRVAVFSVRDRDLILEGNENYMASPHMANLASDGEGNWILSGSSEAAWYGTDPMNMKEAESTPFQTNGAAYCGERFVATTGFNKVWYSKDKGKTWREKKMDASGGTWTSPVRDDGGTCYIPSLTDGIVIKTEDGKRYDNVPLGSAGFSRIYDLTFSAP